MRDPDKPVARKRVVSPYFDGIVSFDDDDDESQRRPYNSPPSPTNLRFARSHAELAGRSDPPLSEGVSLLEPLDTDDYWNWD